MIFGIITLVLLIEVLFTPRLGFADERILLWYGKKERKYIIII